MIPVTQSIVNGGDGDCLRAAVASILDITLEEVPHFVRYKERWFDMFYMFMNFHGWEMSGTWYASFYQGVKEEGSVNGYFITIVPSSMFEGKTHAVIMDISGTIVHDPNPNQFYKGKTKEEAGVLRWYVFKRKEKS